MKQPLTIVLTGGGSGGHITPILSLAHELKDQQAGIKLIYIGHKGDKNDNLSIFDEVYKINGGKFRRYNGQSLIKNLFDLKTLVLNFRDIFRVIVSIGYSFRILGKVRPDIVFSKGSFVAVPVGIAARARRVPIITHDSDTIPGLANRIIGRWASIHATGMPVEFYDYPKSKTYFTGIPVSKDIKFVDKSAQASFKSSLGINVDELVLLVVGGGNGSQNVNNLVISSATSLLNDNLKLNILHVAGLIHQKQVESEYHAVVDEEQRKRIKVLGFVNDFYKYSGAADLIISRAGATALAEFAVQHKPVIVIPNPYLVGGHQLKNAAELSKIDASVVLDNNSSSEQLVSVVNELLKNTARRNELGENIAKLAKTDASRELAQLIIKTAQSEEL